MLDLERGRGNIKHSYIQILRRIDWKGDEFDYCNNGYDYQSFQDKSMSTIKPRRSMVPSTKRNEVIPHRVWEELYMKSKNKSKMHQEDAG